jgi:hypothetical protein
LYTGDAEDIDEEEQMEIVQAVPTLVHFGVYLDHSGGRNFVSERVKAATHVRTTMSECITSLNNPQPPEMQRELDYGEFI